MSFFTQDFSVDTGCDFFADIILKNNPDEFTDLRGFTIAGQVWQEFYPYGVVAEFQVTHVDDLNGHFQLQLLNQDTQFLVDRQYEYEIIASSGDTIYSILKGYMNVTKGSPTYTAELILQTRAIAGYPYGVVQTGTQGPTGIQGYRGTGFIIFQTKELMDAATGTSGIIAYANDYPDQYWKWSIDQNAWTPAF
jgi:hypothetical protein